jgi:hypothetical protein
MRVFRAAVYVASLAVVATGAEATTITYDVAQISGSTWQYDYSLNSNSQPAAIGEFTVFFALGEYSNLSVEASPGNWSSIVAQPDPNLPADGFFDAQALDTGLPPGSSQNGFSVQFMWLGAGRPGAQPFNVVDPNTFATLETGNTTPAPVPLPASLVLLISGLLGTGVFKRLSPGRIAPA